MKRFFLLLVLVVCVFLPTLAYAGSLYADVADTAPQSQYLPILSDLRIISGIEENGQLLFHGEKQLTRAEAAKLMVFLSNASVATEGLGIRSVYTDVDASHWASDYITYLSDLDILRGMGDGRFAPEEPLLSEQLIKMLVCLLGYAPQAEGMGGYPVGYLAVASETKLLKGCTLTQEEPISRENAARLCYNALDIALMKQVLWSEPAAYVVTGSHNDYPEETLLTACFNADKLRGVITETYYQAPVNRDDLYIVLTEKNGTTHKFDVNATGAETMLGKSVSVYTITEEDAEQTELFSVFPDTSNRTITLPLADTTFSTDGKGRLQIEVEKERYTAQSDAHFYCNGDSLSPADMMAQAGQKGQVTLLYNTSENTLCDYVFVDVYTETSIVKKVWAERNRLTFKDGTSRQWDETDDSYYISFFKDGKPASFSDIQPSDVLSIATNASGTYSRVFISDNNIFGRVTGINEKSIAVDGVSHPASREVSVAIGHQGYFFLDVTNEIVFYEKETSALSGNDYGYLFNISATFNKLSGKSVLYAKLMDNDGFWNELTFAQKVTIQYGEESHTARDTNELLTNLRAWTGGLIRYIAAEEKCYISEGAVAVVQYELNEAYEVKTLTIPQTNGITDRYLSGKTLLGIEYDKDMQTLANLEVSENTVIFTVKNGETDKIENIGVGYAATILEKNTPYFGYGYVSQDGDTDVYNALCLFTEEKTVMGDTPFIIVEETFHIENQAGVFVPAFWGYTDGKSDKRLFILHEDAILTCETVTTEDVLVDTLAFDSIEPGDTVAALFNDFGEITHLSLLMAKETVLLGTGFSHVGEDRLHEDIEIHYGYVYKQKKDKDGNKVFFLSTHVTDDAEAAEELARIREVKLNGDVYLVDITKPQVKISDVKDFDDVLPLNIDIRDDKTYKNGYGYFIYAKMYEDEIIGATIYVVDCKDMVY